MNIPAVGKIEKERRQFLSLANVLTLLGMAGAIVGSYAAISADNADTKRRVTHLEQGEQKTHTLIKENAAEVKNEVRETRDAVQLILRKLDSMEAVQRERDRRERASR